MTKESSTMADFQFAAIQRTIEAGIPKLTERKTGTNKYLSYGEDNKYPEYLFTIYKDVTSLKTIIEGITDYVLGEDVVSSLTDKKIYDLLRNCVRDYLIYGGCAMNIIRTNAGDISNVYWVDFRMVRTDEDNQAFWISKEWAKKYGRTSKAIVLPAFIPEARNVGSSILYLKNSEYGAYPIPQYSGAIKACEIERKIDALHLNGLANGFMPSAMINFNNGIPDDEQKAQIEHEIYEKFVSEDNAGRIILSFNNGKDNATTIDSLKTEDFGEKYQAAAKRSREQIYAAFRAEPQLFGIQSDNSKGFSGQEYAEAFKLFNKTVIVPLQKLFTRTIDYVFGVKDSVRIVPFTYDDIAEKQESEREA